MTRNTAQKTRIVARQIINGFGEKAWQFGAPDIHNKGTISYSGRNWKSKASALRAGRREYRQL